MEYYTAPGQGYVILTVGGTVTSPDGAFLLALDAGQSYFRATTDKIIVSDPSATIHPIAKWPGMKPIAVNILGKGTILVDVPESYIACSFLESTGDQLIDTGLTLDSTSVIRSTSRTPVTPAGQWEALYDTDFYMGAYYVNNQFCFIVYDENANNVCYSTYTTDTVYTIEQSYDSITVNGEKLEYNDLGIGVMYDPTQPLCLFNRSAGSNPGRNRLMSLSVTKSGNTVRDYLPALDEAGVPCMFDRVTKLPFYSEGGSPFIIGMTAAQAPNLANLPEGGGTLTVSLPMEVVDNAGTLQDAAISTALSTAGDNGWTFILQTYNGEAVDVSVPPGYTRLEFLESTGTQYLDTGITLSNESAVTCEYVMMARGSAYEIYLFGARGSGVSGYTFFARSGNNWYAYCGDNRQITSTYAGIGVNVQMQMNSEYVIYNDVKTSFAIPSPTFETENCFLYRTNYGKSSIEPIAARVYSFTLSRSSTEQANYVPAISPDGTPCMWDSVSKTAKYNSGRGSFVAGMNSRQALNLANLPTTEDGSLTVSLPESLMNATYDVVDPPMNSALKVAADNGWTIIIQSWEDEPVVPEGYIRGDFLESVGEQYIDTGIKLSSESEVNCTYSAEKVGGGQCLYGAFVIPRFSTYGAYGSEDSFSFYAYIGNSGTKLFRLTLGKKNRVKHTSASIIFNDSERFFEEVEAFTQISNCGLYGQAGGSMMGWFKVFSFSIARADTVEANYVPALDDTGKPCMYDKVTGVPKYNSGTGDFIFGLTSEQALNLANLPITEDGTLTVSLPESIMDATYNVVDPATISALDVAADNGWTITIQSWEDKPVLPEGYIRGNFLESTRTQYIDTGYTSVTTGAVRLDVQDTVNNNNGYAGASTSWDAADSFYIRHLMNEEQILFKVGAKGWSLDAVHGERMNIYFAKTKAIVNDQSVNLSDDTFVGSDVPFYILRGGRTYSSNARCFSASLYDVSMSLVRNYIPALDDTGKPCMYDKVSKTPFYNANTGSGNFIFGLTSEQALDLANLPTTEDGSLTVSLPEVVVSNGDVFVPSIRKAFDIAATNGWTLIIQTYGDGLPAGSIPLDFLESTGTQWIDTGVKLNNESLVSCKYFIKPDTTAIGKLFGSEDNGKVPMFRLFAPLEGYAYFYSGGVDKWGTGLGKIENKIYSITATDRRVVLNGQTDVNKLPETSWETLYAAVLFGCSSSATHTQIHPGAKVYSFAIANQTAPQANYVPFITADGVPAMWDYVSKTAKLNAGTGSFIAGLTSEQATKLANLPAGGGELTVSLPQGDVTDAGEVYTEAIKTAFDTAADNGWTIAIQTYGDELPGGCVPAEFLESTETQYIDTGVTLSNESLVTVKASLQSQHPNSMALYGTYHPVRQAVLWSIGTSYNMYFMQNNKNGSIGYKLNEVYDIVNGQGESYANGTLVYSADVGVYATTNTAALFAAKIGTDQYAYKSSSRIYNFSISRAGTKQANYTPIITAAGVPAMWDSVTRTAKYNAGTGSFVVGLTAENALKLANLPATTDGTLTISLPSEVVDENGVLQDEAIADALLTAVAKGWTFIIQTYEGVAVEIPLPQDYLECEFLESTGAQYINTGIVASAETELSAKIFDTGNAANAPFFGSRVSDKEKAFYGFIMANGYQTGFNVNTVLKIYSCSYPAEMYVASGVQKINGEIVGSQLYGEDSGLEIYLYTANQNGARMGISKMQVYSFSIARSGVRQLNYTPAISPDGTPCMWDSVTAKPFTNAGTGQFVVGMTAEQARKLGNLPVTTNGTLTISLPPDVVDEHGVLQDMEIFTALSEAAAKGWNFVLQTHDGTAVETAVPAGYMECEFLRGGAGQHIAVDCALTNDSIVTVDCTVTDVSNWQVLLGGSTTSNLYSLWSSQAYTTRFDYGSNIARADNLSVGRHILRKQGHRNFIDGEEVVANTESTTAFTTGNAVTMFRPSNFDMYYFRGYIHFASIELNSTYQRYFIPALDSTGAPCMYDTVTAQPFNNAGTGAFIVGMTAAQAVQLANLPEDATDKNITVSLPQAILNEAGEITDAAVNAALNKAADNGWTITLQYHTQS